MENKEILRRCILVAGMHRSGTSALARVFNILGATLPSKQLGAGLGNEGGHWEPERLVNLHNQLLEEAGSSWHDWRRLDLATQLPPQRLDHFKSEIRHIIEEDYGDASLFVLKDPRVCRFVPLYRDVLDGMGIALCPVIPFRNPFSVAASLHARDHLEETECQLIWLRHILDAEAATRDLPRAVLSYEDMLDDWRGVLAPLGDRLGVNWPLSLEEAGPQIDAFLSKSLAHHPAEPELLGRESLETEFLRRGHAALRRLASGETGAADEFTALSAAFEPAAAVFARSVAGQLARSEQAVAAHCASADARAEAAEARRELALAEARQVEDQMAAERGAHAATRADLDEARRTIEALESRIDQEGQVSQSLRGELSRLGEDIAVLQGALRDDRAQHAQELKAALESHARDLLEVRANHAQELEATLEGHAQDLLAERANHTQELKAAQEGHARDLLDVRASHERELRDERVRAAAELAAACQEHAALRDATQLELQHLRNLLAISQKTLEEHQGSTIWQATAPVRHAIDTSRRVVRTVREGVQATLGDFRPTRLLNLQPVQHLERVDPAEDLWLATGADPVFNMVEQQQRRLDGWVLLQMDLQADGESPLNPSIYVDDGRGFREETRIMIPADPSGKISRVLRLPRGTVALRFDPAERTCSFRLGQVARMRPLSEVSAAVVLARHLYRDRRELGNSPLGTARQAASIFRRVNLRQLTTILFERYNALGHRSDYADWRRNRAPLEAARLERAKLEIETFAYRPVFSIVMPTYKTPEQWLIKALDSVRAQVYPHWELCIADDATPGPAVRQILERYAAKDDRIKLKFRTENGHISIATNDAMTMISGDYMCLMDHDDEIAPNALYEFARVLNEDRSVEFIYSDEDKISITGQHYEPFFKPDWSPILLESCMYTAHFACYRMDIVRKVGGFRPECNGAQDYDFVLRFTEHVTHVRHVPQVLYHWRAIPGSTAQTMDNKSYVIAAALRALTDRCNRTGAAEVVKPGPYAGSFAVRRKIIGTPKVSIVIPSAGRDTQIGGKTVDLLASCVESIFETSSYKNVEVVVVDNGDLRASTTARLAKYPVRFVTYDLPEFNVATKMNMGAEAATGEYVLFLNDDIAVITPDWLEAMIAAAQLPNVGMVGAKLHFEDGTLQHVGVTTCNGWPDHIRRGFPENDPGYFFSCVTTREVLSVTGACCLMPRELFWQVGGFNEDFAINYNDIDLCMKVRATGASIVQSSQAELFHYESRNRVRSVDPKELDLWKELWETAFATDPYYSPIFTISPPTHEPDFGQRGDRLDHAEDVQ